MQALKRRYRPIADHARATIDTVSSGIHAAVRGVRAVVRLNSRDNALARGHGNHSLNSGVN